MTTKRIFLSLSFISHSIPFFPLIQCIHILLNRRRLFSPSSWSLALFDVLSTFTLPIIEIPFLWASNQYKCFRSHHFSICTKLQKLETYRRLLSSSVMTLRFINRITLVFFVVHIKWDRTECVRIFFLFLQLHRVLKMFKLDINYTRK